MLLTRPSAAVWLAAGLAAGCASKGPETTGCPDGGRVAGTECHLAPDGTYYGDGPSAPDEAGDDVMDAADREVDEESGLIREEVIVIEAGGD